VRGTGRRSGVVSSSSLLSLCVWLRLVVVATIGTGMGAGMGAGSRALEFVETGLIAGDCCGEPAGLDLQVRT
jgi:hypothetical protein